MIHRRHFLWTIILMIGALSLISCGSKSSDETPAPTPTGTVTKFAILDGTQESPAVNTTANGSGSLIVDTGTGAVSGSLTILSPPATAVTAAHVHDAAAGNAVIIPLSDSGNGVWSVPATATPLTAAQISSFTAGTLYFNAHTTANAGGEIRGNINKATATLYARLDGAQESPAVTTTAAGTGILTVDASTGVPSGSLTITVAPATTVNAAHVHDAAAGNAVIIPLSNSGGGVWSIPATATPLTAAQISSFIGGKLYFNAHTTANPGGEIRGNIILTAAPAAPAPTPTGTVRRLATLDGAQEVPAVTTTANGAGSLTVDTGTGTVSGSLVILSAPATTATAAHVHDAAAGNAVIIPLSNSGGGVWSVPATATPLTAAQISSFTAGTLYFNVHTTANAGGEIRGNINKADATLNARLDGAQEVPSVITSAAGTGILTVNADTGLASGSLTITVAPATTVTAAHVHDAAAGNAVIIPLNNLGSGVWGVPTGTVLTAAQISSFVAGNLYFNVHTVANAGGEIRGNIKLLVP
jgi:hypothetical protein